MAQQKFNENWNSLDKTLKNPETNQIATRHQPFNTGSEECYVKINKIIKKSHIKQSWMCASKIMMGLPEEYQLRASDSITNPNQIDLKIAESKDHRVPSFYNFHVNYKECDEDDSMHLWSKQFYPGKFFGRQGRLGRQLGRPGRSSRQRYQPNQLDLLYLLRRLDSGYI